MSRSCFTLLTYLVLLDDSFFTSFNSFRSFSVVSNSSIIDLSGSLGGSMSFSHLVLTVVHFLLLLIR